MSTTPRLGMPYILQSQSQKEVTHNDSLNIIDVLIQPAIESADLSSPPASPADGSLWIVGAGADAAWAGKDESLAQYIDGGWRFLTVPEGFSAWLKDRGAESRRTASGWETGILHTLAVTVAGRQVLGAQQPAIADAADGATQDTEARAALNALLAACRSHGLIAS